jgi:MoaA/NifB/PqqE/SkfB family radical SAM enzyme
MSTNLPDGAVWDITYACGLRCQYCYSESGRRASKLIDKTSAMNVTRQLQALRSVVFSGGEPTLAPFLKDSAETLQRAGVSTILYTNGAKMSNSSLSSLMDSFGRVHLSLDSGNQHTHDRLRGRVGSFSEVMTTLESLQTLRLRPLVVIEMSVVRSNFDDIKEVCALLRSRFPFVRHLNVGLIVPSGLATREHFAETELVSPEQLATFRSEEYARQLQSEKLLVQLSDNWGLMPTDFDNVPLQIEPDGSVRAFPLYEGVVGSLAHESLETVWRRAQTRHRDPWVVNLFSGVTNLQDWAAAARAMDLRYGAPDAIARIAKRPITA